ncbi:MAG: DUF1622 domain-containing protein [Nitrososphaeraceae archaeon]
MQSVPLTPEQLIRPFLEYLTVGIDVVAGIVIAISIIRGFIMFLRIIRKSPIDQTKREVGIKRYIGNGLILALDIEVGSDIIKTILTPSTPELLALAVVVGIRIALSWSLSRDIGVESENQQEKT